MESAGTFFAATANSSMSSLVQSMCAMSPERARRYGFVSHYNHTGRPATDHLANDLTLSSGQLWRLAVNPVALHVELGGWGGAGVDPAQLPQLAPALFWGIFFVLLRHFLRRHGERLGLFLRVVEPRARDRGKNGGGRGGKDGRLSRGQRGKLKRFYGQLWLLVIYVASSVFGYAVQRDKPWFGLPVRKENYVSFLSPHPYKVGDSLLFYYQYGLGFYISELVYLLVDYDIKRSDFLMFLTHHLVTIVLMVLSHCSYEHRFGAYVLFIHDASDVMLALTKVLNYVVEAAQQREQAAKNSNNTKNTEKKNINEKTDITSSFIYKIIFNSTTVNVCFAIFAALFVFFRIICLPSLAFASIGASVKIRMCTLSLWVLILLLHGVIQGLQLCWFALIAKLVFNIIIGTPLKDIRSEDDESDDLRCD